MKNFTKICQKTQAEVKQYMESYLKSFKYNVICEDGFLYAKGEIPVLLVAHMDTVHRELCKDIVVTDGKISSPQGIGGDDRCGIYIIRELVKELKCSVLLCEDEECGGIGASKFARTEYIKNLGVNYMIEFDRKGNNDAVFYSCGNQDFINHVLDYTGYKKAQGTFSDISSLMPSSKLCGVNLSSGYYKPHNLDEYVVYEEMLETINAAKALIKSECNAPFEYKTAYYPYSSINSGLYSSYYKDTDKPNQMSLFDARSIADIAREDNTLELEALVIDKDGEEKALYATGTTKMECWFEFFMSYPEICLNDIIDYTIV